MDKNKVASVTQDNAEAICANIDRDAAAEAQKILDAAMAQAQNIIASAREQAAATSQAAQARIEKDIQKDRERLLSTMNLEKKKIILEGKQAFVDKVLAEITALKDNWRRGRSYHEFLLAAVVEGMRVLEAAPAVVYYSCEDEHIFNQEFIKKIIERCNAAMHKQCDITFNKSDFKEPGVIVNSRDGRMMYDNRFSARLERMYDELYMELMKEAS